MQAIRLFRRQQGAVVATRCKRPRRRSLYNSRVIALRILVLTVGVAIGVIMPFSPVILSSLGFGPARSDSSSRSGRSAIDLGDPRVGPSRRRAPGSATDAPGEWRGGGAGCPGPARTLAIHRAGLPVHRVLGVRVGLAADRRRDHGQRPHRSRSRSRVRADTAAHEPVLRDRDDGGRVHLPADRLCMGVRHDRRGRTRNGRGIPRRPRHRSRGPRRTRATATVRDHARVTAALVAARIGRGRDARRAAPRHDPRRDRARARRRDLGQHLPRPADHRARGWPVGRRLVGWAVGAGRDPLDARRRMGRRSRRPARVSSRSRPCSTR